MSAVLPADAPEDILRMVPLLAARAVLEALAPLGLPALRLRWPNDILLQERKLAGLLVERVEGGRPVAGIGLNISNDLSDPAISEIATRLDRYLRPCPTPKEMVTKILESLSACFLRAKAEGLAAVLGGLEEFWGSPRPVALDLDGIEEKGVFEGVEPDGRLRLRLGAQCRYYDPSQVRQLTELREMS